MHALGFPLVPRRYTEPGHRATSATVPDILSALVCGAPQLQYERESKAEATACQKKFPFGSFRTAPAAPGEGARGLKVALAMDTSLQRSGNPSASFSADG